MKRNLILLWYTVLIISGVQAQSPIYLDYTQPLEKRIEDALSRMTLDEKIAVIHAQSKFSSPGIKRLGFPDLWTDDGPHGVRPDVLWDEWDQAGQTNDSCVAFPALTCLAASWNQDLAKLYGESLAEEALYRNKNVMLAPGVNINRTPLCGRNFEYMGEDPYLTSRIAVPYIKGLQSKGVAACVKHYALNNDEEYRHQVNVIVSERALHEIYLPAFKAAVQEAGVWSIMGAYNLYNNQHNCHNDILLNKILKDDWKFDGVVISDWGGCHNTEEAVKNGLDLEFGSWTDGLTMGATNAYDKYYMALNYKNLIKEGKFTTKELDDKVRRILRLFYRTTMAQNRQRGFLCSENHYDAAKTIAHEGIVLLKNDRNILPLDPATTKQILVVGENAIKMMTVGGGSSSLKAQKEILPLDGIRSRFANSTVEYVRGYIGDTVQSYNGVTSTYSIAETRSAQALRAEALEKARTADVVLFFGGLNKSNYQDCEGHDRKQYGLPYNQGELIEAIAKVNKNLVYVNISGNAVEMPWIKSAAAIVQMWFLGSISGEAIAEIIAGDVCPSGKLPFTWYQSLNDCGAHSTGSYPGTWRADHKIIDEEYKEGIFVGYRWTDKNKIRPLFPFGYGLSYTTFEISNFRADKTEIASNGQITFSAEIKNTGTIAGSEVLQLYISEKKPKLERPKKELKGFCKVNLLPGETKTVQITLDISALSYYDDNSHGWKADSGEFAALAGTSSGNIISQVIFKLKQ
ncbi:MAG: glycoside hydrolase family 3 C-terminal domain-containing protein [Bacteroidales bacterium]|nr:glycoside hydrolase family 3 C-terminal domain-containing protein [Bacteroidales bacterium]